MVFGAAARLRRGKPLHPRGSVVRATAVREGTPPGAQPWGAAWLDEPGTDPGLVRLSRAAGLPAPLPDVLGLALRADVPGAAAAGPGGAGAAPGGAGGGAGVLDVPLATTGLGRLTRFVLVPRWRPGRGAYGSLLPYRTTTGRLVLLAARPEPVRSGGGLQLQLLAASPRGPWRAFGRLHLHGPLDGPDAPVDLDPVLNPPPGLAAPAAIAAVRAPAWAAARRARASLRR
ncbi:hypothetical protein [Quadrisphaera sp. DSM 44207]|uniref:hypothetical protein n=1 Tax=Quadrisphaera sp. DSM 44207 TaxID=1881057 RepID=UPI00088D5B90|nr:hypothetical protein [Quadrisphaera sp. DSM 44207]SDQ06337.1 hypothetical protein SAMN05428996_0293 [Quadrisphaera sp. DSM 44207]